MRLTSKQKIELKNGKATDYYGYKYEQAYQIIQKLGQIEDIEEELGIDLITLFKALKNGVYYRNNQKQINFAKSERVFISHKAIRIDYRTYKFFKDYGKTFALTKEELL